MANPKQPRKGGKFTRRTETAEAVKNTAGTDEIPQAADTATAPAETVGTFDAVADAATAAVSRVEANLSVKGLPAPKAEVIDGGPQGDDEADGPLNDPGAAGDDPPPPAQVMGGEEVGEIIIDAADDIAGGWREKARMSPAVKKTAKRAMGAALANVGFGAGLLLCVCAAIWGFAIWTLWRKEAADKPAGQAPKPEPVKVAAALPRHDDQGATAGAGAGAGAGWGGM